MKKIIILLIFAISQATFSQIAMTSSSNGAPLVDGSVLVNSQTGYPIAENRFKIRNTGSTTTNVWARCVDLLNNNGTSFQFCFGEECIGEVTEGGVYPSVALTLAPNGTNGNFDHFLNDNLGSGTFPLDFVFKFFQTNQATQGGAEVGNSITITYRYDPNLSVDEINQLQTSGVIVKSTIIENEIVLDVLKNTAMVISDLNGKIVYSTNLNYGIQTVDFSDKSSGVYIIRFTNEEGNTSTKKIIKK